MAVPAIRSSIKSPDYFAGATEYFGISDYARWYQDDYIKRKFRDEMDVWIGCTPDENPMVYQARSNRSKKPQIQGNENLITP